MEKSNNKLLSNLLIVVIGIAIVVSVFLIKSRLIDRQAITKQPNITKQGPATTEWSAIYLTSGEIYVSPLDYPVQSASDLKLSQDAYMLQIVKNEEGESNFQLTPLDEFLWAPKELYVNRDQVVLYAPIKETSTIGAAIVEAGKWEIQ